MTLYQIKHSTIEAFQIPPEGETCGAEMVKFLDDAGFDIDNLGDGSIEIFTSGGRSMLCIPGDWIIKNSGGHYFKEYNDTFKKTYELHVRKAENDQTRD